MLVVALVLGCYFKGFAGMLKCVLVSLNVLEAHRKDQKGDCPDNGILVFPE